MISDKIYYVTYSYYGSKVCQVWSTDMTVEEFIANFAKTNKDGSEVLMIRENEINIYVKDPLQKRFGFYFKNQRFNSMNNSCEEFDTMKEAEHARGLILINYGWMPEIRELN